MSSINEIHFSECRYVLVNGFVYNVKQQLQAVSRALLNSSNHLSDIDTKNLNLCFLNFRLHTQQQ